jgi:archaemetzincin
MRRIGIVPVGPVDAAVLERLGAGLGAALDAEVTIENPGLDPRFAFHPERRQHHATAILARLVASVAPEHWRLVGVTAADLYIPILTFVFGEAQLEGPCAVVSTHRLRPEFYGLPPDSTLLDDRLLKESVHELGHTLGLVHCSDWRCAMASSHDVERIDLKGSTLCYACRAACRTSATRP